YRCWPRDWPRTRPRAGRGAPAIWFAAGQPPMMTPPPPDPLPEPELPPDEPPELELDPPPLLGLGPAPLEPLLDGEAGAAGAGAELAAAAPPLLVLRLARRSEGRSEEMGGALIDVAVPEGECSWSGTGL